jgi:hypothetical protein
VTPGERFAAAVAARDKTELRSLLAPELDFRALSPSRSWEAATPAEAEAIVTGTWFEDSDHVKEVLSVSTGEVGDRSHVAYRFLVTNADGDFVVEQQAYYDTVNGTITWMRILCSGFRQVN